MTAVSQMITYLYIFYEIIIRISRELTLSIVIWGHHLNKQWLCSMTQVCARRLSQHNELLRNTFPNVFPWKKTFDFELPGGPINNEL